MWITHLLFTDSCHQIYFHLAKKTNKVIKGIKNTTLRSVGKSFGILKTWNDPGPSKRVPLALCPSILSDFVVKWTWWLVLFWKGRERKTSEHGGEILSNCNYLHGVHILCTFCFYCPASHTVLSSFSPFKIGPKSKVCRTPAVIHLSPLLVTLKGFCSKLKT